MFSTAIEIFLRDLKIEFSRLVLLCFLVSKICLYISAAPLWTFLLKFLEEIFAVSEFKTLKPLIALTSVFLALILAEAAFNRIFRIAIKDWHGPPEDFYKKLEQRKPEPQEILELFSNSILEALTERWELKKILMHLFPLIIIMVSAHLFLIPFAVLVLFSMFDMVVTPSVAVISFLSALAIFPLAYLIYVPAAADGGKRERAQRQSGSVFGDVLRALIFYLIILNRFSPRVLPPGLPARLLAGLPMLLLMNPWFFILRHDCFVFRLFVYTVKPEEIRMENFDSLVGYYYDVDLNRNRSRDKSTQVESGAAASGNGYISMLGDAIHHALKNRSRQIFSAEISRGGLIVLKEKDRCGTRISIKREVLCNYLSWVHQVLQYLRKQFENLPGFEIRSLRELDLDREEMSSLFRKSPVVLSLDFEPYFDCSVMEVLNRSLKKEKLILATTALLMHRVKTSYANIAKDSRKPLQEMELFFVLPIVFVFCFE